MMTFKIFNISANFQNYINKIMTEKLDIFVIVNLNNIFIHKEDPGQVYINVIRWVFK